MLCEPVVENVERVGSKGRTDAVRVLAFVHLRNIHASTGAGRVARQVTEHLAKRPDVDLRILADREDASRILPLVGTPWTDYHYHLFQADTSRQQLRWLTWNSPPAERFWPRTEIVYCAGESYVPAVKARLVVTAHDAAYFEEGAHKRDLAFLRQRWKWKILFRKIAAKAAMVHTVSTFSAERLEHYFPNLRGRISVVPNAVTSCFFAAQGPTNREYLEQAKLLGKRFVLVPGGLHYRKNADLILQAAGPLLRNDPELTLVVAGHCDGHYRQKALEISNRVLITGFVHDEALHAMYGHASVVWFPSRYEGFGLPVLEAMASGAPVLASRASSIPEIAGNAALLAEPDDPAQHVEGLIALLEDAGLRSRLMHAGRIRAAEFTWMQSAARLAHHFNQLL